METAEVCPLKCVLRNENLQVELEQRRFRERLAQKHIGAQRHIAETSTQIG